MTAPEGSNPSQASQVPPSAPAPQRGREAFGRYLRACAAGDNGMALWAEFVDRARVDLLWRPLPGPGTVAWQRARDKVLSDLAEREASHAEVLAEIDTLLADPELAEREAFYAKVIAPHRDRWLAEADLTAGPRYHISQVGPRQKLVDARAAEAAFYAEWDRESHSEESIETRIRQSLTRRTTTKDIVDTWCKTRAGVLKELVGLGLVATVMCTDGSVPIEEHDSSYSGLVRVHRPGENIIEPSQVDRGDWFAEYADLMEEIHGLRLVEGLPETLRGFCGQYEEAPRWAWWMDYQHSDSELRGYCEQRERALQRPRWMDHVQVWLDSDNELVLTAEPYRFDDQTAFDVVMALEGLPLKFGGRHPGVWHDAATLLMFRWDPDKPSLPAERRWIEWCPVKEEWAVAA